jgi:hypothetical protein
MRTWEEFVDWVGQVEGFKPTVYSDLGVPAIGNGHRLLPGESFTQIDEKQARELRLRDLAQAAGHAEKAVAAVAPGTDFNKLPADAQMKLTERAFNLGPYFYKEKMADGRTGFPKWTQAVISGDVKTELAEHHRKKFEEGVYTPMEERNKAYERFFHPEKFQKEQPVTDGTEVDEPVDPQRIQTTSTASEYGVNVSVNELFGDPGFRAATMKEKVEALRSISPMFDRVYNEDPVKAEDWIRKTKQTYDPGMWSSAAGGAQIGVSSIQRTMANVAQMIEEAGYENDWDESWRAASVASLYTGYDRIGSDWQDQLATIAGSFAPYMVVPMAGTIALRGALAMVPGSSAAVLAPFLASGLGFGIAGFAREYDEGLAKAGKVAAIEGALGIFGEGISHMGRMRRIALESMAAYAVDSEEHGPDRAARALAFGAVAGLMPGRKAPLPLMKRWGARDLGAESRLALREAQNEAMANTASRIAAQAEHEMPLAASDGTSITNLETARYVYEERLLREHPMSAASQARPDIDLERSANIETAWESDPSPVTTEVEISPADLQNQSQRMAPGPLWEDSRAVVQDEALLARVYGDEPPIKGQFRGEGAGVDVDPTTPGAMKAEMYGDYDDAPALARAHAVKEDFWAQKLLGKAKAAREKHLQAQAKYQAAIERGAPEAEFAKLDKLTDRLAEASRQADLDLSEYLPKLARRAAKVADKVRVKRAKEREAARAAYRARHEGTQKPLPKRLRSGDLFQESETESNRRRDVRRHLSKRMDRMAEISGQPEKVKGTPHDLQFEEGAYTRSLKTRLTPRSMRKFLRAREIAQPFARAMKLPMFTGNQASRIFGNPRFPRDARSAVRAKVGANPYAMTRGFNAPDRLGSRTNVARLSPREVKAALSGNLLKGGGPTAGQTVTWLPWNLQTMAHEWGHAIMDQFEFMRPYEKGGRRHVEDMRRIYDIFEQVSGRDRSIFTVADLAGMRKAGQIPDDLMWVAESHGVSYDAANITEGWSEAWRHFLTNNREFNGGYDLDAKIPHMHKIIKDFVKTLPKEQQKAIKQFQSESHQYLMLSDLASFTSKFGPDANIESVMASRVMQYRQSLVDDLAGIMNLERMVFGRVLDNGVYMAYRNLRGVSEAAQSLSTKGMVRWVDDPNGGPGARMIEHVPEWSLAAIFGRNGATSEAAMNRALMYSIARRAQLLKKYTLTEGGRRVPVKSLSRHEQERVLMMNDTLEKRFTEQEIAAMLRVKAEHPEVEQIHTELMHVAKMMREFGKEAGLWNDEQMSRWLKDDATLSDEFVMSFMALAEYVPKTKKNVKNVSSLREDPTSMLRGSTEQMKDPLHMLIDTHARTFRLAIENIAHQKLLETITRHNYGFLGRDGVGVAGGDSAPAITTGGQGWRGARGKGGGRFGFLVDPINELTDQTINDVRNAIFTAIRKKFPGMPAAQARQYIDSIKVPAELEKVAFFVGENAPVHPDILTVRVKGVPVYFKVKDDLLKRSLMMVRRPEATGFENGLNWIRKFQQRVITLSPGFMVANFVRDIASASVMSKTGHFHLRKSISGLISAMKEDKHYNEYLVNGGGTAGISGSYENQISRLISAAKKKGHDPTRYITDAKSTASFLARLSRAIEMSSRLGEYKSARQNGARVAHAAYMSREVSTDFAMRGDNRAMNFLSNTVPFFNAMIAGNDRAFRAMFMDPTHRLQVGLKTGMLMMAASALYAYNRTIPQYNGLEEWDKTGNFHFYFPKFDDDNTRARVNDGGIYQGQLDYEHWRLPKLYDFGLFVNIAEKMWAYALGDDDEGTQNLWLDALNMISQNFMVNLAGRSFPLPVPAGLNIVLEQVKGESLFTGNPIEDQSIQNQQQFARLNPYQKRIYGEWGKLFETTDLQDSIIANPARAESLLRGLFGEFAVMGAMLAEEMFFENSPSMKAEQIPGYARLRGQNTNLSRRATSEFYDNWAEFKRARGTMAYISEQPGEDVAERAERWAMSNQNLVKLGLADMLDSVAAELSYISNNINALRMGHTDLDGKERTAEIDRLQKYANRIQYEANQQVRDYERQFNEEFKRELE